MTLNPRSENHGRSYLPQRRSLGLHFLKSLFEILVERFQRSRHTTSVQGHSFL